MEVNCANRLWENNVSQRQNRTQKWCINETFKWRHWAGSYSPEEEAALQINGRSLPVSGTRSWIHLCGEGEFEPPPAGVSAPSVSARSLALVSDSVGSYKNPLLLIYLLFLLSSPHYFLIISSKRTLHYAKMNKKCLHWKKVYINVLIFIMEFE